MNQLYETIKNRIEEELVKGCGFKKADPLAAFAFLNLYCYDDEFNDYPVKLRLNRNKEFYYDILINGLDPEKHLSEVEEVYYNPADPGDHIILSQEGVEVTILCKEEHSDAMNIYYFNDTFEERQKKHLDNVFEQLKLPREQRKLIPYK